VFARYTDIGLGWFGKGVDLKRGTNLVTEEILASDGM
jgi:hypothetical protein